MMEHRCFYFQYERVSNSVEQAISDLNDYQDANWGISHILNYATKEPTLSSHEVLKQVLTYGFFLLQLKYTLL